MKSRGTKSTQLFRKPQLYDSKLNALTQRANYNTQQLLSLKSKIAQSKPILETIYHKIQLKENLLEQKYQLTKRRFAKAQGNVHNKLFLHEQAIKKMKKVGLLNQYSGKDNYPVNNKKDLSSQFQSQLISKIKTLNNQDQSIMPQQPPNPIKAQNAFSNYQQKLQKARTNINLLSHNNHSKIFKEKIQQVTSNLRSGIEIIRTIKQQFRQNSLNLAKSKKGSKSEVKLKINKQVFFDDEDKKIERINANRFIQNKSKRLNQQRNKL